MGSFSVYMVQKHSETKSTTLSIAYYLAYVSFSWWCFLLEALYLAPQSHLCGGKHGDKVSRSPDWRSPIRLWVDRDSYVGESYIFLWNREQSSFRTSWN